MDQAFQDVLAFHRKFCPNLIGTVPAVPEVIDVALRLALIREEVKELYDAAMNDDLPGVADGAIDLIYVVLGMLVSYGIDPVGPWNAVQAANMAKVGGGMRPDGKIMKPQGWKPPDIAGILNRQHPIA